MSARLLAPQVGAEAPPWRPGLVRLLAAAARHCLDNPLGILAPLLALPLLLLF